MSDVGLNPGTAVLTQRQRDLVDCHLDDAYRLAHAMLADSTSAADAVVDAFVGFVRGTSSADPEQAQPDRARVLVGLLHRRCLEVRRASGSRIARGVDDASPAGPRGDDLWSRLPPTIRDVVALVVFGHRSIDEIVALTGLSRREVTCSLSVALATAHTAPEGMR